MTPEEELLDTIEEIRRKQYPELPAELVKQIIRTEQAYPDDRSEASRRISEAIDQQLNREGDA
jgi:hypothetical protein